jgi:hypothetical protein
MAKLIYPTSTSCSSVPSPSVVARGTSPTTPASRIELLNERRFSNGVVFLRYRGRI